ncbi:MAG: 23S rRNA (adenine(2503)-C(2))-methyltransferase RlmN [Fibrobacter sp.]|jgi:23S rRNA (adenine2503-C2)-methyltransferase|nr:23S rRNA (adenine(2503)-C(2))-methyltransferase RlmN [Fibrobacter sp.]
MSEGNDGLIRFKNLKISSVADVIEKMGEKKFRATQIMKWVYQKRVDSFELMNNMPKVLRQKLSEKFSLKKMELVSTMESRSRDAVKFGFLLHESSHIVESVLLIDRNRRTACLSSQLGCGLGCVFCETGKMGLIRNLAQDEIIGQLIGINDFLEKRGDKSVTNIVFMGMGEALSNFENFRSALDIIMNEDCFNIGGRRITVSTAGVIPSIERLMNEDLNIGLAISLNAFSDKQRSQIMPVNNKYPIARLIEIAKRYFDKTGRRVTFEYVLIEGETDTDEAVNALSNLLGGFPCKINVIPVNPGKSSGFKSPAEGRLETFANKLHQRGLSATLRKSRGKDIYGACGQLSSRESCVRQD